ncbi:protein polybromo-1-like [Pyrus ussuriensis x Pyrus communis]|uniref:Protein polybromo-1-like n=1 Tax=Pyrus ussuriensis x Pyrus communis TaxID=2448454 RepID=A0A5N5GDD9_9ROSA|nr:protein polybromo-1-like [Pyrus ussuriensis x Pyrus communis]
MAKPKAPRRTIDSHTIKPINKTIRKKSTNKPCGARGIRRKGVDVQTNMVVIRILELLVFEDIKLDTKDVVGVAVVGEVEKTQVLRRACTA